MTTLEKIAKVEEMRKQGVTLEEAAKRLNWTKGAYGAAKTYHKAKAQKQAGPIKRRRRRNKSLNIIDLPVESQSATSRIIVAIGSIGDINQFVRGLQ